MISPLSIRNRFWTPFWTLPGSLGGAFWPPRWLQPVLRFLLERPRAAQRIFFSAPRGEKEGSKKGAKKEGKKSWLRGFKMDSRWIQDGFKRECPAECAGPVLAHLSLLRPEYSAASWKHAQHHQRWAADRSRAFRRAWGVGLRALGEGAFSEETWPTWWQHRFEMAPT